MSPIEDLAIKVLMLALSGLSSLLIGLVFRRQSDMARDLKEISGQVGNHTAALARNDEKIAQLRRDVDEIRIPSRRVV